ncbi:Transformation/transcription domain-associated protein, partial [Stegodyphus mimosarum]
MAGLRCTHPYIRKIFCGLIDEKVYPQLRERLIYILTNVNWENMGPHFWIKQCIEMVVVAAQETYIQSATHKYLLPSVTSIIEFSDAKKKESHLEEEVMHLKMKNLTLLGEREEARNSFRIKKELICSPLSYDEDQISDEERLAEKRNADELSKHVQSLLTKNNSFQSLLESIKTSKFLSAVVDLCHLDTPLAEYVWLQLFPKIWSILNIEEQKEIGSWLQLFLCNNRFLDYDIHPPRPLEVFADAALRCSPVSSFSLDLYKYAGKCLNRWERSCLVLEDTCFQNEDFITEDTSAFLEALTEAYSSMEEEDLCCGMWQKFGTYPETILGVTLEKQGFFPKAMHYFRQAMSKYKIATLLSP